MRNGSTCFLNQYHLEIVGFKLYKSKQSSYVNICTTYVHIREHSEVWDLYRQIEIR